MYDLIQTVQVLTPEEVKFVNSELDKKEFVVSSIGFADGETGEPRVDSNIRSSSGCYLKNDEEASKIIHKGMNNALLEYHTRLVKIHSSFDGYPVPGGFMTTSNREEIQVLEYVQNQKYTWHTDASSQPNSNEYHRKISIILYLSDDFEGGSTKFVHKKYKPSIGHALIFPSNWCFPHCGTMVTKGKKRVAVTWYYVHDNNI
tara:strand:+ start:173 stop:778 length:606 start_codon:yes stop_codon:yes gene_type:complete